MQYLLIFLGMSIVGYSLYYFGKPRKPKKRSNSFTIPDGPITRDMKDPYSQTLWAAFDSGKAVSYNSGDDHMKSYDTETGETEEIKLKN
jgi:hypothetical protein